MQLKVKPQFNINSIRIIIVPYQIERNQKKRRIFFRVARIYYNDVVKTVQMESNKWILNDIN